MAKKKTTTAASIWTPKKLRSLRDRLGLTQAEIADRIHYARRTWMYWESGKQPISSRAAHLITLLSQGKL